MQATGFDQTGFERWKGLVDKALKGASFESLTSQTDEGITLEPIYAPANDQPIAMRAGGTPWVVAQRIDHPDAEAAYAQTMAELEGGASGLVLVSQGAAGSLGYGIDLNMLPTILDDVLVDAVRLTLEPSPARARDARAMATYLDARATPNAHICVDFGLDPASLLAASGGLRGDGPSTREAQARHFGELASHGFKGTVYRADGRVIHNAGGTDADELAFVLASLVFAIKSGEDPTLSAQKTLLGVAVDADQFAGIAKLRALRLLHAKLMEAAGIASFAPQIQAETSSRMLTRLDPHVNMLRATTAVFAAAVGGADSITALPFSQSVGHPDSFARRTARNTQLVLMEESHLHQVGDPASGSGLYESYTQALCKQAWEAFQAIEREGGVIEALVSGHIQAKVKAAQAEKIAQLESGKRHLTGTTVFQLETEYPVDVEDVAPVRFALKDGLKTYAEPIAPWPWNASAQGAAS
ncbi:MAG: methylmalonyl-CoA mutase [Rhizobiales bacterium]|nr:methylmalonyl-CoA mutase [Hyphomicrobiales bacterium]MBO6698859.1 methylmalonyl-CoA mutase [Hyphomicrobiales bacterium]MBO6734888.1 methylmalonyl-CoA mutase [Hyphomicrobiales bacterium]MBO6911306.1 methylmalonyl-CoA mutase [Hyphomicrobiales bacterium]MBO6956196.1 methylmalonyl-CoA mutase [Hyphomicrobiales bacterium]